MVEISTIVLIVIFGVIVVAIGGYFGIRRYLEWQHRHDKPSKRKKFMLTMFHRNKSESKSDLNVELEESGDEEEDRKAKRKALSAKHHVRAQPGPFTNVKQTKSFDEVIDIETMKRKEKEKLSDIYGKEIIEKKLDDGGENEKNNNQKSKVIKHKTKSSTSNGIKKVQLNGVQKSNGVSHQRSNGYVPYSDTTAVSLKSVTSTNRTYREEIPNGGPIQHIRVHGPPDYFPRGVNPMALRWTAGQLTNKSDMKAPLHTSLTTPTSTLSRRGESDKVILSTDPSVHPDKLHFSQKKGHITIRTRNSPEPTIEMSTLQSQHIYSGHLLKEETSFQPIPDRGVQIPRSSVSSECGDRPFPQNQTTLIQPTNITFPQPPNLAYPIPGYPPVGYPYPYSMGYSNLPMMNQRSKTPPPMPIKEKTPMAFDITQDLSSPAGDLIIHSVQRQNAAAEMNVGFTTDTIRSLQLGKPAQINLHGDAISSNVTLPDRRKEEIRIEAPLVDRPSAFASVLVTERTSYDPSLPPPPPPLSMAVADNDDDSLIVQSIYVDKNVERIDEIFEHHGQAQYTTTIPMDDSSDESEIASSGRDPREFELISRTMTFTSPGTPPPPPQSVTFTINSEFVSQQGPPLQQGPPSLASESLPTSDSPPPPPPPVLQVIEL